MGRPRKIKTTFSQNNCFICGRKLNDNNRSDEHVYPKWLQREFSLWNQNLILLNNTTIRYRNLTIPCCIDCNNIFGNKVEKPIKEAYERGIIDFLKLDDKIIFQWLNKISYGVLFKELFLKSERANYKSKSIYQKEFLKEHKMQIYYLQSVICETQYLGENPWSILKFKIKKSREKLYNANDFPFVNSHCYFMQLNDVGIIASLFDGGVLKQEYETLMEKLEGFEIHPVQFAELCSLFFGSATILKSEPWFHTVFNNSNNKVMQILCTNGNIEFGNITFEKYKEIFDYFLKQYSMEMPMTRAPEEVFKGETFLLFNENRVFRDISNDMNQSEIM